MGENGSHRSVEGCISGQAGDDRGWQFPEGKKFTEDSLVDERTNLNPEFMGAMTEKGPSDLRTSKKPAFSTISRKLESSGSFSISSTMLPARAPLMTNANTTKFILSETPEMTKKKVRGKLVGLGGKLQGFLDVVRLVCWLLSWKEEAVSCLGR